jgi:iron(III) transport system substrate-binding protein
VTFTTRTKTGLAGALAGGLIITGVLVSTATPAVTPKPAPHPSLATLIAGSKKEDGKLVIYGNPSQQVMAPVIAAFQAAYPWVKITHYDLDDNTIFSKYIAEHASGSPSADLLISSAPNLWIYASRKKLAADFTPRDIAKYPSFARQYKGIFVMSTDPAITIYNKLLLKSSSDVPTGLGDLARRVKADPGTYGKLTAYTGARVHGAWLVGRRRAASSQRVISRRRYAPRRPPASFRHRDPSARRAQAGRVPTTA